MISSPAYIVISRLVFVAVFMNMQRNNSNEFQYGIAASESSVD